MQAQSTTSISQWSKNITWSMIPSVELGLCLEDFGIFPVWCGSPSCSGPRWLISDILVLYLPDVPCDMRKALTQCQCSERAKWSPKNKQQERKRKKKTKQERRTSAWSPSRVSGETQSLVQRVMRRQHWNHIQNYDKSWCTQRIWCNVLPYVGPCSQTESKTIVYN